MRQRGRRSKNAMERPVKCIEDEDEDDDEEDELDVMLIHNGPKTSKTNICIMYVYNCVTSHLSAQQD